MKPAVPAQAEETGLRSLPLQGAGPAASLQRYRWATLDTVPLASWQQEVPGTQVEPAGVSKSISSDSLLGCAEQIYRYSQVQALKLFFVLPCQCFDFVTQTWNRPLLSVADDWWK